MQNTLCPSQSFFFFLTERTLNHFLSNTFAFLCYQQQLFFGRFLFSMAARLPSSPLPSFTRPNARVSQHSVASNSSSGPNSAFVSSSPSTSGSSLLPSTSTVIANENALNSSRSPDRNSPLSAALSAAIVSGSRQSSQDNAIRDIEKCGWLRFRNTGPHTGRSNSSSSSSSLSPLSSGRSLPDNYWAMFCVLNETEPVLELFAFKQPLHRKLPDAAHRFSLLNAQHVTASITPYEHNSEHEFVITLQKHSVRLTANSHTLMQEWMEALSDKLVALEVLPPRFNIYSKEPTIGIVRRNPNIASRPLPPIPTEHQQRQQSHARGSSSSSPPPCPLPSSAAVNANRLTFARNSLSPTPPARPARILSVNGSHHRNRFLNSTLTLITASSHQSSSPLSIPSRPAPARPRIHTQFSDEPVRSSDMYEVTFQPHTSSLSRARPLRSVIGLQSNNGVTVSGSVATGSSPQLSQLQHSRDDHLLSTSSGDLNQTLNALNIRSPLAPSGGSAGSLALGYTAPPQLSALSLRESQVLRLRSEIEYRDGVRFHIRSRDLQDSLALCDWMGHVWVAGWKQRHRPQLHNAFHIGDRLLSVAGESIVSTAHAYALFREPVQSIELIVRRTPHAQVFLIKRQYDAQDLGIERDGNRAEIVHVQPEGLAARFGVSAYASSVDSGASAVCNWWITEINNRPLNLFFKRNEVRDRLNAVGREISLLLQPSDLIRQLRRQLKTFKNYKDYVVQ